MTAPIVYRWDDGNAPVARGERRSLCDILHACLVTGYGSKAGAGWTRPFVNATFDIAVFRNSPLTGTGFFIQIDGLGGATAFEPIVRGFEVMTDYSTTGALGSIFGGATDISNGANTTARPWILIADDRAFYFVVWTAAAAGIPGIAVGAVNGLFFGDLIKNSPSDAYACGLAFSQYNTGVIGSLYSPDASTGQAWTTIYTSRRQNGSGSSGGGCLIRGGGPGGVTTPGQSGPAYDGQQLLYTRPHLNDNAAYTFRGFLPGFYYPCHPYTSFGQFQQLTADGKTFLNISHNLALGNSTQYGCYFIQLNDWRV